jgi:hypothetical protein
MKFSWDISSLGTYAAYALALWHLLRGIRWVIRRWNRMRKAAETITPKSRRDSVRFFSAFIAVLAVAFGLLLLLAVTSQQASPQSRTLPLLAGGVAALTLIGVFMIVVVVPAYNYVMDFVERQQVMEQRLKVVEVQVQAQAGLLEEQFPVQPKLAFMENTAAGTSRDYTS